jgi:pimeloyl-ACP methyl ester carboxylesterase
MSNMDVTMGSRRDTWIIVCEHFHGAVGPIPTERLAVDLAAHASGISECTYRPVRLALAQGRVAGRPDDENAIGSTVWRDEGAIEMKRVRIDKPRSRREALGVVRELTLSQGRIRYRERGDGSPVVFVHGLLVNADLWRAVVPTVAESGLRCIAPNWPFGSHEVAVPNADLSPPGAAALVASFLERLDLRDVTVVANDTGGAITQILMTQHPERLGRIVLTSSDSLERFFPPTFAALPRLARVPGSMWILAQLLRVRALQRLPIAFGWAAKRPMPSEIADSYLLPSRRDAAIRRDLRRFLRGVHRRHTLAAARRLPGFTKPVLLAWAREDRLFPLELAHRLAALLPRATVVTIEDSYTLVPEDQPELLAGLVVDFVRADTTTIGSSSS